MWTEEEMKAQHAALFEARKAAGSALRAARRSEGASRARATGAQWALSKFYPEGASDLNPEAPCSRSALASTLEEGLRTAEEAASVASALFEKITALDADLDGLARLAFGYYRLDLDTRPCLD